MIVVCVSLAGCATPIVQSTSKMMCIAQKRIVPPGSALVYVFGPDTGCMNELQVELDGKPFGRICENVFLVGWVDPGVHTIVQPRGMEFRAVPATFEAKAGETYFFEADYGWAISNYVKPLKEKEATKRLSKQKLSATNSFEILLPALEKQHPDLLAACP